MTETRTVAVAPGALPLLGHVVRLAGQGVLGFFESLPDVGDLVEIRIGTWRAYVVCHPDLAQRVFMQDRIFDKGGPLFTIFREIAGNGVGTCPHPEHRRQRRLLQPAFHSDRFPEYAHVMTEQTSAVMDSWHEGLTVDVSAEMRRFTSKVLSKTLLAPEATSPAALAVEETIDDIERGLFWQTVMPSTLLRRLPIPVNRRYRSALAHLHAAVDGCVQHYRSIPIDHADLLSAFLATENNEDKPLTDSEIHDQVITFMLAGITTTATTLTWALRLLAEQPDIEKQVHSEVDTVLGGRIAVWDDLPYLEFTSHVINEALRLYPPLWLIPRRTTEETELAGCTLPAGTTLICSPYLIHHRTDVYPDPDRFDPDRWIPDRAAQRPRNTFIPFGAGARKCIGATFGITEATLILASISARWQLSPISKKSIRPIVRAGIVTGSLPMRLHRRAPERAAIQKAALPPATTMMPSPNPDRQRGDNPLKRRTST
ncbi:cytochrome P450 [Nocardia brasiliensis]